jgi:hypothetical protein
MIECGRQPHSCQALVEPEVDAQTVPLWRDREMDDRGVMANGIGGSGRAPLSISPELMFSRFVQTSGDLVIHGRSRRSC